MKGKVVKIFGVFFVAILIGGLVAGCKTKTTQEGAKETAAYPLAITDDVGRKVTVKKTPQRIISLAPSNTEILFALGLGNRVVGVTTFCDYPPGAKKKEKIGGFKDPNLEKVIFLKPDLVLATGGIQQPFIQELEKVGISVFVLHPKNLNQVIEGINKVGKITGRLEESKRLTDAMSKTITDIKNKVASQRKKSRPKVFVEIFSQPLYSAGTGTFIDDLIRVSGGKNIAAQAGSGYVVFSLENLLKEDPDVYMAVKGSMNDPGLLKKRAGFSDLKAVKNNRVYVVDDNLVSRPGPRIVQGLKQIAKSIHPDLFK
jgi:iron complex transport system substrate-binding protein